MTTTTFVDGGFCALHAPFSRESHGHDWFVRATFRSDGAPINYLDRQKRLDEWLAAIDHGDLNSLLPSNPTNEGVAEWIGRHLKDDGCVKVKVWRFEKGRKFGATWKY
jgi:6-pyruvoyl-tetrahydropterin synthase